MTDQHPTITVGMNVINSDNESIGTVETIEHEHLVVKHGSILVHTQNVPLAAIAFVDEDAIHLQGPGDANSHPEGAYEVEDAPLQDVLKPEIGDIEKSAIRAGVDPRNI